MRNKIFFIQHKAPAFSCILPYCNGANLIMSDSQKLIFVGIDSNQVAFGNLVIYFLDGSRKNPGMKAFQRLVLPRFQHNLYIIPAHFPNNPAGVDKFAGQPKRLWLHIFFELPTKCRLPSWRAAAIWKYEIPSQ